MEMSWNERDVVVQGETDSSKALICSLISVIGLMVAVLGGCRQSIVNRSYLSFSLEYVRS